ncbi:MAG: N-6 DNA methylase [bacterium]|nr:N-6 DNA methylase [bacterium]
MAISSEFHSYIYIKNELAILGWNVCNPTKKPEGEVYMQNECLQNKIIKQYFLSRERPENIIVVRNNKFWIIEAKPEQKDINKAINQAKEYAEKLNKDQIYAPIITAVAGNDEDTYVVQSFYYYKGQWKLIEANGKVLTGLLPKETAHFLVDNDIYKTEEFNLPDDIYYAKAKKINAILHIGSINKNNRAKVMSALLLALLEDNPLNLNNSASVLIQEINARVEKVLYEHKKREFAKFVQITTPPTPDNHVKFRKAIIDSIQELQGLNIRSAMNSGTDILGRFYESFLKYGNGAKEIGIVLTPRHLTRFGAEVINVNENDIIFDPACGTGGFLVSAFDYVKNHINKTQLDKFKENNIFGIEQEPEVVSLALVNMIFRGDGKNNIIEGNCFAKKISKLATKVLMNPPFALKKDDEKEYRFIDNALLQMEDNGLMFVILPSPIMFKGRQLKFWRENLLKNHTLEAVIKLPEDLFYPIAVHTSAVIIRKGIPHQKDKNVFWGYLSDGFVKKKGIMKKSKENGNLELIKSTIKDFLNDSVNIKNSVAKTYIISPILFDNDIECAPEFYLKDVRYKQNEISEQMKIVLSNLFNYLMNNFHIENKSSIKWQSHGMKKENFENLFNIINAKSNNIEDYSIGDIPFITSTELNNGVEKYIEPDEKSLIFNEPCITLSSFGFATVQIPPFVARSHGAVLILKPKQKLNLIELSYFAAQINLQKWRFSYGRWVTKKRLLKLEFLPLREIALPDIVEFINLFKERCKIAENIFKD